MVCCEGGGFRVSARGRVTVRVTDYGGVGGAVTVRETVCCEGDRFQ